MYISSNNRNPQGACGGPARERHLDDHVKEAVARRVMTRLPSLFLIDMQNAGVTSFYVAGSACLRQEPGDIDIWPDHACKEKFAEFVASLGAGDAPTRQYDFVEVQFCGRGEVQALDVLVKSFDFAHCQAGVLVSHMTNAKTGVSGWYAADAVTTPAWKAAMAVQGTWYCGGKWPLRSLSRVPGIAIKLGLTRSETRELAMQCTRDAAVEPQEALEVEESA